MARPIPRSTQIPSGPLPDKFPSPYMYHVTKGGFLLGPGMQSRQMREELCHQHGLSEADQDEMREADALLLKSAVCDDLGLLWIELLDDDPNQPLSQWWWHLGALRAGTFPLDQLPDYLIPVYYEAAAERDDEGGEG